MKCACDCHQHAKLPYIKEAIKQALDAPKKIILWISPTMSKATLALKAAKEFVTDGKVNLTHCEIIFKNGSKIYFANANNPDKFRGLKLNAVFIEEGVNKVVQDIISLGLLP